MESNKKIIEYDIIEAQYLKDTNKGLISLVNKKIKEGWIPLGGLCGLRMAGGIDRFHQTMIKYEIIKYN